MAPYRLGIVAHELKQGATNMLAARRFVHAQVIDIQSLAVLQQAVVFHFLHLAERIAKHLTIVIHKDGFSLVFEQHS